jgi:hypothetical protein
MNALLILPMLLFVSGTERQTEPSVSVSSAKIASDDALSETQYRDLLRCTLTKNTSAVEAYVDSRFELGRGLSAKFEKETGGRLGPVQLFSGCFEFPAQSGTFPFDFDQMAADWAAHFGVTKEDPNTLDKEMGIVRVRNFAEYVSCVRQKNAQSDIQSFVSNPLNTMEAVQKFNKLGDKCSPENGVNLKFNMATLAEALKEKGAQN